MCPPAAKYCQGHGEKKKNVFHLNNSEVHYYSQVTVWELCFHNVSWFCDGDLILFSKSVNYSTESFMVIFWSDAKFNTNKNTFLLPKNLDIPAWNWCLEAHQQEQRLLLSLTYRIAKIRSAEVTGPDDMIGLINQRQLWIATPSFMYCHLGWTGQARLTSRSEVNFRRVKAS